MTARHRIAFFCPSLEAGGAERSLIVYLQHIDRERFEPHLILIRHEGELCADVPDDVVVHELGRPHPLGMPRITARFIALIKQLRPDTVVSFLWYCDAVQLAASTVVRQSWNRIVTIHNLAELTEGERFGAIKMTLLRRLYPTADRIIAVSAAVAEDFRRAFLLPQHRAIEVLYNPRSIADIRDRAHAHGSSEPKDGVILVAVGRLVVEKGLDTLLTACSELPSSIDWRLRLVGDGPLRGELAEQCRALSIHERVEFCGFLDDPYPAMASADIFVLPSRSEGLPGVLCEAMALGLPIIASAVGGVPELLEDGHCGVLVQPDDELGLSRAIASLIGDEDERARLSQAALVAANAFDATTIVARFEGLVLG